MKWGFRSPSCFGYILGYTWFDLLGMLGSESYIALASVDYVLALAFSHLVVLVLAGLLVSGESRHSGKQVKLCVLRLSKTPGR